ncbi:uncharacterized protein LOC136713061 [Amia ocellicauda]|uniref:uncharacterized protein LOC136713061 n=1 Tax=Amia ocellicauda TaxID=2972642 RepID=UPI003464C866
MLCAIYVFCSHCCPSIPQAVKALHRLIDQLHSHIKKLYQDQETQKRSVQQITRDKERELRQQREELSMEREQALDLLKERLIQEHVEEVSKLQRTKMKESRGGESQVLRQQLWQKDEELRAIQRSMSQWKDQTAAKLALKFEEEFTSELER